MISLDRNACTHCLECYSVCPNYVFGVVATPGASRQVEEDRRVYRDAEEPADLRRADARLPAGTVPVQGSTEAENGAMDLRTPACGWAPMSAGSFWRV